MPPLPPIPPDGPRRVPEEPRAVRDPRLDGDELRLLVDQAHADVRRAESAGPALALGALLACLPLLVVLAGLLLR